MARTIAKLLGAAALAIGVAGGAQADGPKVVDKIHFLIPGGARGGRDGTARGPGADLWIARKGVDRIVVRGAKDVAFDYFVQGVRAGYADFQTIRPRTESATNAGNRDARTPARQRNREARQQRQRGR